MPSDQRFDMVTIGAGAAGLVTAIGGAALGKKSALVEARHMGGDCTNYGCIPSKSLVAAARAAHGVKVTARFGLGEVKVFVPDFEGAMRRVRGIVESVRSHESAEELEKHGVRVFPGRAAFENDRTVVVRNPEGEVVWRLTARNFVIATGSHPMIPDIPGIDGFDVLTNETIFDLTTLPRSLLIIGGGPIGMEIGQCFLRFGSEVTVIEATPRALPKEESHTSRLVEKILRDEGMRILTSAHIDAMDRNGKDITIRLRLSDGNHATVSGDAVFVAAGRKANLRGVNCDAAGVEIERDYVRVNRFLQTSRPHIYACGDVVGGYQFTHVAEAQAKLVLRNILFPWVKSSMNYRVIPWVTYTDPEVAHVGMSIDEAINRFGKGRIRVYHLPALKLDRATTESEYEGFTEILTKKISGRILGATIVGSRAGDVIGEICLAMARRIPVYRISTVIHPYPTFGLGIRKTADLYFSENIAEFVKVLKGRIPLFRGERQKQSES